MALTPTEIVIGGNQSIYVAPEGTTLPDGVSDILDPAFVHLGFTTEAGVKFTDNKTVGEVKPSQSFYSVRNFITAREALLDFVLLQWNRDTVDLAFGGGTWTEPTAGEFRYHPPAPETIATNALVVDATDGDRNYRITVSRGFVISNTAATFARTGPSELAISFRALASIGGGDPWTFDTDDDAAFASAS